MLKKKIPSTLNADINIEELLNIECSFGKFLRALRTAKKISIRELAKNVHKTPTYISDIEKGNNRPPNEELLHDIILSLNLGDDVLQIRNKLFDLAAKERGVVSADIAEFIMQDDDVRNVIRLVKTDEKVRNKILSIVK